MAIIAVVHVDEQASRSWHAHLTTCLEMRTSSVWLKGGRAKTIAVVHVVLADAVNELLCLRQV